VTHPGNPMVNSVGKQLQQARIAKQLSIEESARVTRIRPDKLIDLEEDNYANFPSMSYAKGFLLLYGRFLGVDVHEYADTLHTPNPVSSDDYEYLNAAATGPQPPPARRPYHFSPRRERTLLPIIVFGFLVAVVVLGIYLVVTWQRIGPIEDLSEKKDVSSPAISTLPTPAATPAPVAVATPAASPTPAIAAAAPGLRNSPPALVTGSPVPAPTVPFPSPPPTVAGASPTPALPAPIPAGTFDPTKEVRRALPVNATPGPDADASPAASAIPPPEVGSGPAVSAIVPVESPGSLKNITILPIRRTLVTVRKDVADSPPIFEDWLYPGNGPLKLSGHKFWIDVNAPGDVQITQDGQALPSDQKAIEIE